jgi:hypothetical protein
VSLQSNLKTLPATARWVIALFGFAGFGAILFAISGQTAFEPVRVISFLTSVVLIAVIREGPAVAILVGVCGVTFQSLFPSRRLVAYQLIFNTGMIAVTVAASFMTFHSVLKVGAVGGISAEMTAVVLASFVYFLGNSIAVSLIVSLTKGLKVLETWRTHFMHSAPSFIIAGILSRFAINLTGNGFLLVAGMAAAVILFVYYCSILLTAAGAGETSKPDVQSAA